jgi:hypothetical protein
MKKPKRQPAKLQKQMDNNEPVDPDRIKRTLNTNYLFWTVCEDKACARARGCAGADPEACLNRFWPAVPEEMKIELRAYAVGVVQKHMSKQEALAYAASEVERWKACQAEDEREWQAFQAALREPEPETAPPDPKPHSGPRIRTL